MAKTNKSTLSDAVKKKSNIKELKEAIAKATPEKLKRLNCDIPAGLFRSLKIEAFDEETSIKEITIIALKAYFKEKGVE